MNGWSIVPALLVGALAAGCPQPQFEAPPVTESASPRIVTLAPHLAELMFAAGAGDHVVAVSAYSDYPDAVQALPVIGDAFAVDQERLAVTRPDVLLAWESGTPTTTVDELRKRGYRVEVLRTRGLDDVAVALRKIGDIAGRAASAEAAAARFQADVENLRRQFAGRDAVRVFYQISPQPLYTVSGDHFVGELIALCGGVNVFAELTQLAPSVSAEAVLARDPELLLAGRVAGDEQPFDVWDRWPGLAANRYRNRFTVPAELIGRATPRLAVAGAMLCQSFEEARRNRAATLAR